MLILNDLHIAVQRKGGTTPASQEALRQYLFTAFEETLVRSNQTKLVILGDLFDTFEVSPRDWLQTYQILQDWCVKKGTLTLVAGNHDHSPKALRVSSFEMLCNVLVSQFGPEFVQVIGIDNFAHVAPDVIALAHCSNQDIFNHKLDDVLSLCAAGSRVLLHANYDNNFAAVSDHSLNVGKVQAQAFAAAGATLYFAHEHQARTAMGGSVVVFGNQWPTSISDCLDNYEKSMHVMAGSVTTIETWSRDGDHGYAEIDWRELATIGDTKAFVKVVGDASSAEAAEVINSISKFRQKSSALVISNGTSIEGIVAAEQLPDSFEAAKAFDVMEFIKINTTAEEFAVVQSLHESTQ